MISREEKRTSLMMNFFYISQDFGDMIPGHGGIMDRFDCQFLMATFVNVYISSFIHTASPAKLLQQVCLIFLLLPTIGTTFINSTSIFNLFFFFALFCSACI